MRPWVRSEYAGELAVLSAWLSALAPWSVTYATGIVVEGGRLLSVRFVFLQVWYAFGVPFTEAITVRHPISALELQRGVGLEGATRVWVAGAAVVGVAVLLSLLYYRYEERVEAGPVDPVRLMGALLLVAGLLLSYATYLFATDFPGGLSLPVGVVFPLLLGVVLLTVDRTDNESSDGEEPDDPVQA